MLLKKRWMKLWPGIEVECCKAERRLCFFIKILSIKFATANLKRYNNIIQIILRSRYNGFNFNMRCIQ